MADPTPLLPPELEAALRAPARLADAERTRRSDNIMAAIAELPSVAAPTARRWALPPSITRWRRRGVLAPAGGLAVALLVTMWVGVTSFTSVLERSGTVLARAEVIGDTIIPRLVPRGRAGTAGFTPASVLATAGTAASRGDTLYDTIYDTMRIVRFALHAPSATQVSLVQTLASGVATGLAGGVARSMTGALPGSLRDSAARQLGVARDLASGLWELRTVVPRDAVAQSFEFVVNGTDRVPVRAAGFSTPAAALRPAARLQSSPDTAL